MLLRCAYIASLCQVAVGFHLGQDLPFNGEALFFAFKLPDVLAKFRVILARFVVERHLMVSEPSFKLRGCKTYIGFGFTGSRHLGLVDDPFSKAVA